MNLPPNSQKLEEIALKLCAVANLRRSFANAQTAFDRRDKLICLAANSRIGWRDFDQSTILGDCFCDDAFITARYSVPWAYLFGLRRRVLLLLSFLQPGQMLSRKTSPSPRLPLPL